MPNTREKLIELVQNFADGTYFSNGRIVDGTQVDDIVDHLIANGVTVQNWISVTDSQKPKDRKRYFIAYVYGNSDMHFFGEAMYHAFEGKGLVERPHFSDEGVEGMRVTHWMEIPKLPQPPKGE